MRVFVDCTNHWNNNGTIVVRLMGALYVAVWGIVGNVKFLVGYAKVTPPVLWPGICNISVAGTPPKFEGPALTGGVNFPVVVSACASGLLVELNQAPSHGHFIPVDFKPEIF